MRFATAQGFNSGDQFFAYLKDSFDVLYRESERRPRMMSVGLHCRLAGRPGRTAALERFLDCAAGHERVWITRRIDIARHWIAIHSFGPDRSGTARRPAQTRAAAFRAGTMRGVGRVFGADACRLRIWHPACSVKRQT
jgi:hypothetical protein